MHQYLRTFVQRSIAAVLYFLECVLWAVSFIIVYVVLYCLTH